MTTPARPDVASGISTVTADMLDQAPCGFVSFYDDGTIAASNATLENLLGLERGTLAGQPLETILTIPSRIFHQTHFFPLLKLHGHAEEIYLTLKSASGAPVHALVNAIRRESEGLARSDCVILPIHERQRYEEELLRAKKQAESASLGKTRFLSMMSHDIRTPLGAMSGFADLLLLGIRGELTEPQRSDVERIKRLSESLLTMVNDILHVARDTTEEVPVVVSAVRLDDVLVDVETAVLQRINEAELGYHRDAGTTGITVMADRDRLRRILVNLLGNASKFTPKGGSIRLSVIPQDDRVLIQVSDTGRGIPKDRLQDIFEPFVQLHPDDAANRSGVGLGLAISREFARAMGGDLTVQSSEGRGSVFTVQLRR